MNNLTTSQLIRRSKVVLMAFVSFFGLLVLCSNFIDYPTNYEYMGHVLSMDTTRDNPYIKHRAVTSPILHHRVYWFIITLEVTYTLYCLLGTYHLYRALNDSLENFHEAKKCSIIGLLIAIFIYYVCMQVIAVEWFDMDESPTWNFKDWARHVVDFMLPLLIYITLQVEN